MFWTVASPSSSKPNCTGKSSERHSALEEDGRLEEGGRWKVVHLQAIANPSKFGPDPLGRRDGDPLPHPKIPTGNRRALLAWWNDVKGTSTVRDWHALSQGDPQPSEGALVSRDLLRSIRDGITVVEPQKIAVSINPSGGGRDTAGVIGGFLGADNRCGSPTTRRRPCRQPSGPAPRACSRTRRTPA
ncbi:hypothetical protein ABZ599_32400 [Streptomyces misionensis]|uniref:hypothetical protein n=1 Tax=Streptomyces misionensis TaxID=67331 RepID=UPI0033E22666